MRHIVNILSILILALTISCKSQAQEESYQSIREIVEKKDQLSQQDVNELIRLNKCVESDLYTNKDDNFIIEYAKNMADCLEEGFNQYDNKDALKEEIILLETATKYITDEAALHYLNNKLMIAYANDGQTDKAWALLQEASSKENPNGLEFASYWFHSAYINQKAGEADVALFFYYNAKTVYEEMMEILMAPDEYPEDLATICDKDEIEQTILVCQKGIEDCMKHTEGLYRIYENEFFKIRLPENWIVETENNAKVSPLEKTQGGYKGYTVFKCKSDDYRIKVMKHVVSDSEPHYDSPLAWSENAQSCGLVEDSCVWIGDINAPITWADQPAATFPYVTEIEGEINYYRAFVILPDAKNLYCVSYCFDGSQLADRIRFGICLSMEIK